MSRLNSNELALLFDQLKKGKTYKQAATDLKLPMVRVERSLDNLVIRRFVVDLSMVARTEKEILHGI